MILKKLVVGPLNTNCYLVWCEETKETAIIDPGFNSTKTLAKIKKLIDDFKLSVKFIINTHGHLDHTCGDLLIKKITDAAIAIHEEDAYMLTEISPWSFLGLEPPKTSPDLTLSDGDIISVGSLEFEVLHTPGHTMGSICLKHGKILFSGDTLFAGSIGRIDLPESSEEKMRNSIRKLMVLPDNIVVYPGHGPKTTIGSEKALNPYVKIFLGI